jgi:hypothetical protein|tara:strand:+ start:480 stop:626 length:147 start_codon:yes stop_codon:yes gene_type:complete
MNKKIVTSQSIMWAAAIIVVAATEEKDFAVWLIVLLATVSIIYLTKES